MKPSVIVSSFIKPTLIIDYVIEKLEVDLKHINYGLDANKGYKSKARSQIGIEDIVSFFESLNAVEIDPEVDGYWEYYILSD